jgi:hypothetical protein
LFIHINWPEFVFRFCSGLLHCLGVCDIHGKNERSSTCGLHFSCRAQEAVHAARNHCDVSALAREPTCHRPSKAGRRASDHDHPLVAFLYLVHGCCFFSYLETLGTSELDNLHASGPAEYSGDEGRSLTRCWITAHDII